MTSSVRLLFAPHSALPLAYFGAAHLSLAVALAALIVSPSLPGPFFLHPKMVALVHLLTLGWLTGSIFGAFYIVAPLALRLSLPVDWRDWMAFGAFTLGLWGMVTLVWLARYDGFVWSALGVTAACVWMTQRTWRGLFAAIVPWPVKLHVALAFLNLLASVVFGLVIGWDHSRGALGASPMALAFAHAHLAVVGWVLMMVVGLSYRLIPMFLPAAMPTSPSLAASAVLIESGLVIVVVALCATSPMLTFGSLLIAAGLGCFAAHIRRALRHRLPRPPALPRLDWSNWQTRTALFWLLPTVILGVTLTLRAQDALTIRLMWIYGGMGILGFLAQVVVGMQGRLVPFYAWYRAWGLQPGPPPSVAANALPSAAWARVIFACWFVGVPCLGWGLSTMNHHLIRWGAASLLVGVWCGGAYLLWMMRRARLDATMTDPR